ncbi:MAG: hypothetical protein K2Q26_01545 [Bdellovibrionales bacterium]|nr:hypothetical protein [Bdellovibrionales bacterium]
MRQRTSLFAIVCSIVGVSIIAWAETHGGGGHGDGHTGIPKVVMYQAINFFIFAAIIFFGAKNKVVSLFRQRSEDFFRQAREAEQRKKELEFQKADLERRFSELKSMREQSIMRAELEAQQWVSTEKERALIEANNIAKDSETLLRAEEQKQMEHLRQEVLEMSMVSAEENLGGLGGEEKAKVNRQFNARLEGANV